jgi:hypothetical protein
VLVSSGDLGARRMDVTLDFGQRGNGRIEMYAHCVGVVAVLHVHQRDARAPFDQAAQTFHAGVACIGRVRQNHVQPDMHRLFTHGRTSAVGTS